VVEGTATVAAGTVEGDTAAAWIGVTGSVVAGGVAAGLATVGTAGGTSAVAAASLAGNVVVAAGCGSTGEVAGRESGGVSGVLVAGVVLTATGVPPRNIRSTGWEASKGPSSLSSAAAMRNVAASVARMGSQFVRRPTRKYSGTPTADLAALEAFFLVAGRPLAGSAACTGGGVTLAA
jgi:hypothetical protein